MNPSASIALIVFIPDSRKRHRSGRGGYGNKRPKISSIVFLPRSAHRPEPRPRERITTMLLGCERAKWLQAHYAFMHYTRCSSRLKSDSVQVNRKMFKKKTIGPKRGKRYSLGRCLWESPHDTRKWSDTQDPRASVQKHFLRVSCGAKTTLKHDAHDWWPREDISRYTRKKRATTM